MSEEAVQRLMGLVDAWAVAEGAAARRVMPGGGMLARRALESALREVLKQPLGDALAGPGHTLQPPSSASAAAPIAKTGAHCINCGLNVDPWCNCPRGRELRAAMATPTPQEPT